MHPAGHCHTLFVRLRNSTAAVYLHTLLFRALCYEKIVLESAIRVEAVLQFGEQLASERKDCWHSIRLQCFPAVRPVLLTFFKISLQRGNTHGSCKVVRLVTYTHVQTHTQSTHTYRVPSELVAYEYQCWENTSTRSVCQRTKDKFGVHLAFYKQHAHAFSTTHKNKSFKVPVAKSVQRRRRYLHTCSSCTTRI